MAKNLCSKKRTPEEAYEVYEDATGSWRWFCLKKYQSPEHEALNPYSRWHCAVQSPMTNGKFEYGDVYAANVKAAPNRLIANLLVRLSEQEANKTLIVQTVTDEVRKHFTVTDLTPRARKHKRYQIDLPAECIHTISKERSIIGPFDFYVCQDGRVIVTDHAWNQLNASMKKREAT